MPLVWTDKTRPHKSFFCPDRIENIRHDAQDDENMTVYTADGVAVCGRVVHGSKKYWATNLDPGWEWVE